jgi:hypothetical protein
MKRFLGLAALVFFFTLPAHAQLGGAISGGSLFGSSFHTLPSYPSAKFVSTGVSGTEADFVPSAFVTYDQAIAQGKAAIKAETKSVARAASENSSAIKPRAKFAMVQDGEGNVVIVSR